MLHKYLILINIESVTIKKPKINTLYFNGIIVGETPVTGNSDLDAETALQALKDKGLYKPTTQLNSMYRQAVSFATTSAYLYEKDLLKAPRNHFSIAPFIVNAAFGIEIYLKTLAKIHGKNLKGHELLKLFDSLPSEAKKSIDATMPHCAKERGITLPINFRNCISELNNTFVEWRYIYEKEHSEVHIQEMIFVMQCLHQVCSEAQIIKGVA